MTYLSLVWQVVLFCTAVASWITTIYMIDHKAHGTLNMGNFDVLYDKPWIRISPYLVGKIRDPMTISASKISIRRFVITDKAPTRAFSWLKAATTAFTFKTLLRHYAKWALTPR